ncbi:MAG: hypothetical protein M3Q55_15300 [Acidobacteriota bacterium]|nr:hypothetical protein [Acidobacteriota bacterium]
MSHFPIDPAENASAPGLRTKARGTIITVRVLVEDITDAMAAGFTRVVIERSINGGLTYAERTVPTDRPALQAGVVDYTWTDRAGSTDYLYRVRYRTEDGDLSEPSDEMTGAGLAILGIISIDQVKQRYFFGIDDTNDAGVKLTDAVWEHYIISAIRSIEMELDIPIVPTAFNEKHDYYAIDGGSFVALDNYPVISVEAFDARYPGGQTVIEFPAEWWRVEYEVGQIQIVPTAGSLSSMLIGEGGAYLPALMNGRDYVPQLFEIEYTAGFATGQVPRNIIEIIGMTAAMGPFNIFGDLIAGAGIATLSLSLDGLSQSIGTTASATNAGFGSRLIQYAKQIKAQIPLIRQFYKRVGRMTVA